MGREGAITSAAMEANKVGTNHQESEPKIFGQSEVAFDYIKRLKVSHCVSFVPVTYVANTNLSFSEIEWWDI